MRTGQNIYKRKDGRWEGRYWKGRDDTGKLIYGFCYGKTYGETKEKLTHICQDSMTKTAKRPQKQDTTLASVCEDWLNMNRLRLKESTFVKYDSIIRKYIEPYLGAYSLRRLNSEIIHAFSQNLLDEHALAPKTVKDILLILHAILDYAGEISSEKIPDIKIIYPKESRRQMRVLSRSEQAALTEYLLKDTDACMLGVLIALWTGMRIGELCALRWDHVSISERYIRIDYTMQRLRNLEETAAAKTKILIDVPKSESSIRIIPLNSQAVELCKHMTPQDPDAYVLTGTSHYMEPRVLQRRFRRYVESCGLEGVNFHALRHTFATRCVEVGFDIKSLSEILGHANTSITLNRYVHCSLQLKRDNMHKLECIGM